MISGTFGHIQSVPTRLKAGNLSCSQLVISGIWMYKKATLNIKHGFCYAVGIVTASF